MRQSPKVIAGAMLTGALMLAGCGGASSPAKPDAPITLKSAAISGATIPALYTCDGKDISPPLEWGAVPAGTGELALFVLGITQQPATHAYSASIAWAIAGINPSLHRLAPGEVPAGAHVGVGGDGKRNYSICPKKGTNETYQFELYGMPSSVSISSDFAGLPVLAGISRPGSSTSAIAHGAFRASYNRS